MKDTARPVRGSASSPNRHDRASESSKVLIAIERVLSQHQGAHNLDLFSVVHVPRAREETSRKLPNGKRYTQEFRASASIGEILRFCAARQIIPVSNNLSEQLDRAPHNEDYVEELHVLDKGEWLADALFAMKPNEIAAYASFISKNSAYSTQHGVKGEEYAKVLIVYDDVEAAWNLYNFGKTLTPVTAGEPTDGQRNRGQRLAYVSFSRALEDLRVLFFTCNPDAARQELIDRNLVTAEQIEIVPT
jgi:DNA helicase II / ATP-dependent DNA helicase PcrA